MTQNEYYEKISSMGRDVYATESISFINGEVKFNYISLHVDNCKVNCMPSYESAIEHIEKLDPAKVKADKIAALKATIAVLES